MRERLYPSLSHDGEERTNVYLGRCEEGRTERLGGRPGRRGCVREGGLIDDLPDEGEAVGMET